MKFQGMLNALSVDFYH